MDRSHTLVTDAAAVAKAIRRCDAMGRTEFRDHYGFGKAVSYFVRHNGRTYDSKPILAVAFGYEHGTKPLLFNEFSGGAATVVPVLTGLGFAIINEDMPDDPPAYSSGWLTPAQTYTRVELRAMFGIVDATINNGVFRPARSKSIWLFVTKEKTADRPQLIDDLTGDVLNWSGQPAGRTDSILIEHLANGDEALLFYRETRSKYPGGGFRYEGPFLYKSHQGAKPASFIFERDVTSSASTTNPANPTEPSADVPPFDPKNVADGRSQVLAQVKRRQGQPKFRKALIDAYGGRCAITDCGLPFILEAAHIHPYRGGATNDVTNGLLLRADIHTLFDLGLIAIKQDLTLDVCASLAGTDYAELDRLRLPELAAKHPSLLALAWLREHIATNDARSRLSEKYS